MQRYPQGRAATIQTQPTPSLIIRNASPDPVRVVTTGVDVAEDRLEVDVSPPWGMVPRWQCCDAVAGTSQADALMADGWEPFEVSANGLRLHLRRMGA